MIYIDEDVDLIMNSPGEDIPLTWLAIKRLAESLTEDQLKQAFNVWGGEMPTFATKIVMLKEDWIDNGDEGVSPKSHLIESISGLPLEGRMREELQQAPAIHQEGQIIVLVK